MYLGLKAALKNFRVIIGSREHLFWLIKNEVIKVYLLNEVYWRTKYRENKNFK